MQYPISQPTRVSPFAKIAPKLHYRDENEGEIESASTPSPYLSELRQFLNTAELNQEIPAYQPPHNTDQEEQKQQEQEEEEEEEDADAAFWNIQVEAKNSDKIFIKVVEKPEIVNNRIQLSVKVSYF